MRERLEETNPALNGEDIINNVFPKPSRAFEIATGRATKIIGKLTAINGNHPAVEYLCRDLFTGLRDPGKLQETIERIDDLYAVFYPDQE